MSDEPRKPIEELLASSARARRAEFGADPKMPNPMRARLHSEIARVARNDEPEARARGFGMWWPRLIIGAAMAALVIGAPLAWWRSRQSNESFRLALGRAEASKEMDRLAVVPARSQPAAVSEIQPQIARASERSSVATANEGLADARSTDGDETKPLALAKLAEENSSDLKKFAEVAIPAAPPAGSLEEAAADKDTRGETQTRLFAEQRGRSVSGAGKVDQLAAKSLPALGAANSPALIADSGTLGQKQKAERTNLRQQFAQTSAQQQAYRRDVKSQEATILNNFQVEQDGRQIRVVDADGSTYTGKIERLAQGDVRNLATKSKQQQYAAPSDGAAESRAGRDSDESANDEFYFRAVGYSDSLKRTLVFEGNYIVTAPPQQQQRAPAATSLQNKDQMPARIVGTAKIPGEPLVQVDAISVEAK